MAISVADNFSYQGTKPLDARVSFDTVAAMAAASDATLYDGCFAYVKATKKYYSYDSNNTQDPTTGKWREFSGGSSGGDGVGTVINLTTTTLYNETVTVTGTYDTYTAVFDNSGHASVNVYYVDTYDVECEGVHVSVVVEAIGLVITQGINIQYCAVNISTSISEMIGETIEIYYGSDPTDIKARLTFDSTLAVSFRAMLTGNYTILWDEYTTAFVVSELSGSINVVLAENPEGSTITPVNDIQTWLRCGEISDKDYTTISQVLSDTVTLQSLISSQNANDYLVRSTDWVSDVCGNSTAMSYIGLNNYSADTLLSDLTWCTAICNSTYFESVLNYKIPYMTSDTGPSGYTVCSSYDSYEYGYYAFDNSESTAWKPSSGIQPIRYVGYQFPDGKGIRAYKFIYKNNTTKRYAKKYELQYTTKNVAEDYITFYTNNEGKDHEITSEVIYPPIAMQGIRFIDRESETIAVAELRVYGRQDV